MEENATSTSSLPLTDVRLIVKSANQQFEDQIIHSVPTWTIRQLKAHLTKVYPSNPTISEQKLIYSGRLLSDELVLKDILRSYKDVETENHIFHLVYTPKISALKPTTPPQVQPQKTPLEKLNQDKPTITPASTSTSTDGLRHRNVPSSSAAPVASTSKAALNAPHYRNVPTSSAAPVASTSKAALAAAAAAASNASSTPIASTSKAALAAASKASSIPAQNPQQIPNMANPLTIPQTAGIFAPPGYPMNFPGINMGYTPIMPFGCPPINPSVPLECHASIYNWVQLVYANYMQQCLKMTEEAIASGQIPLSLPPPQYFPHIPPPPIPTVSSATPTTTSSSIPTVNLDGPSTSRAAAAAAAAATTSAPRPTPVIPKPAQPQPPAAEPTPTPVPPPPAPAQPENVEQPQPRFPNIVQEEPENRDWLDSFYSITRLLALLTLVYVYSSPLRCLMVAVIAVGIYLYHIGFLQRRRPRNNNNNQNVNDNNAPAEAQERDPLNPNPPVDPAAGDAGQNPAAGPAATPGAGVGNGAAASSGPAPTSASNSSRADLTSSSVTPPENEQPSTSLIAFVRTFVVSFFASLLPETPAL